MCGVCRVPKLPQKRGCFFFFVCLTGIQRLFHLFFWCFNGVFPQLVQTKVCLVFQWFFFSFSLCFQRNMFNNSSLILSWQAVRVRAYSTHKLCMYILARQMFLLSEKPPDTKTSLSVWDYDTALLWICNTRCIQELVALGNYREQIKPQSESVFSTDEYGSNNIQLHTAKTNFSFRMQMWTNLWVCG